MMVSPDQCRAARALLGWSVAELAAASSLGTATIKRFEAGQVVNAASVTAVERAIAGAGLILLDAGEPGPVGGEGVRRA